MKITAYHATSARLKLPFKAYTHFGTLTAALTHLISEFPQTIRFTADEIEAMIANNSGDSNVSAVFTHGSFEKLEDIISAGDASLYEATISMKNPLSFTRHQGRTMSGAFQIVSALNDCGLMEEAELDYIFNKASGPQDISMDKVKMTLKKRGYDGLEYFDPLISGTEPSYLTFFPIQVSNVRQITDATELQARIAELAPKA